MLGVSNKGSLQWGRDQLIAELVAEGMAKATDGVLQWGRDQLIAELERSVSKSPGIASFNGAAIS